MTVAQSGTLARRIGVLFEQGLQFHRQNRLADAEGAYREVVRLQPAHSGALHMLGVVALQGERAEASVAFFDKAVALKPDFAEAYNNRAIALGAIGRFDDAIASYDRAIALRPDNAEAYCNRGNVLKQMARPADALASYDRAIALRPDYAEAHYNRGTVLVELERPGDALASYDRALALRVHYPKAHYTRGVVLSDLQRHEEAVLSHDRAIALLPDYVEAHHDRATALYSLQRHDAALEGFDRAIALRPQFAEAHHSRGIVLGDLGKHEAALAGYDTAISLKPDYSEAFNNRGKALAELGRHEEALKSYEGAIALRPDFAIAHVNIAFCLLGFGQLERGFAEHEWRIGLNPSLRTRTYRPPVWAGRAPGEEKTVFVYCEQGLGDTLQFCRYGPLLEAQGLKVVMAAPAPLLRLLETLSPTIELIGRDQVPQHFDFHSPMLSLPATFGTRLESIPSKTAYLSADNALRSKWASRLGPRTKPRIGVVWSGSPLHANDHNRTIAFTLFQQLLLEDFEWVSLQKETRERDLTEANEFPGLRQFGDLLEDFADTAALVDLMDLVITVDTSVAHLTGALGKPVWILLPFNPDWRWLHDRPDSPWYPSARLFRQNQPGDWSSLIEQLKTEVRLALTA